ncbi:MAG: hypothetical protein JWP63_6782 [Candidatus Solibacter sp.]|nr:hypothetical protein [Candidatus Solibacter sp.]
MRKTCTRTLSLLKVIVFIGLSSSMPAENPVVRGQLHLPAHELVQGLFVIMDEVSSTSRLLKRMSAATAVSSFAMFQLEIICCVSPMAAG